MSPQETFDLNWRKIATSPIDDFGSTEAARNHRIVRRIIGYHIEAISRVRKQANRAASIAGSVANADSRGYLIGESLDK
jgi:hypothetical protein